jgi:hypothetical protein
LNFLSKPDVGIVNRLRPGIKINVGNFTIDQRRSTIAAAKQLTVRIVAAHGVDHRGLTVLLDMTDG